MVVCVNGCNTTIWPEFNRLSSTEINLKTVHGTILSRTHQLSIVKKIFSIPKNIPYFSICGDLSKNRLVITHKKRKNRKLCSKVVNSDYEAKLTGRSRNKMNIALEQCFHLRITNLCKANS